VKTSINAALRRLRHSNMQVALLKDPVCSVVLTFVILVDMEFFIQTKTNKCSRSLTGIGGS